MDSRAHMADIRVQGSTKTRTSFLRSLIYPHLLSTSGSDTEDTLEDVLHRMRGISDTFRCANIFSSVEVSLEPSRLPLAKAHHVGVVLKVRDKPRIFLKGSTETGNSEGSAVRLCAFDFLCTELERALRRQQPLEYETHLVEQKCSKAERIFRDSRAPPIPSASRSPMDILAYRFERDHTAFASSSEGVTGIKATVRVSLLDLFQLCASRSILVCFHADSLPPGPA